MNNEDDDAYKLAMLAAQLCPELCKTQPDDALNAALELLFAVKMRQEAGKKNVGWYKQKVESRARELAEPVDYGEAVKAITGEDQKKFPHLERAKDWFRKFWTSKNTITEKAAKHQLLEYERGKKKFTLRDKLEFRKEFLAWKSQPKKKKGNQGRVKTPMKDERLGGQVHDGFVALVNEIAVERGVPQMDVLKAFGLERRARGPLTLTAAEKESLNAAAVKHGWVKSGDFAWRKFAGEYERPRKGEKFGSPWVSKPVREKQRLQPKPKHRGPIKAGRI
jgi:hypothetical protein